VRCFPVQLATRLPDWSAGGLLRCIVSRFSARVVSFSKFHAGPADAHDLLRTSSRVCHEENAPMEVKLRNGVHCRATCELNWQQHCSLCRHGRHKTFSIRLSVSPNGPDIYCKISHSLAYWKLKVTACSERESRDQKVDCLQYS